jgi:hypothetical protein
VLNDEQTQSPNTAISEHWYLQAGFYTSAIQSREVNLCPEAHNVFRMSLNAWV